MFVYAFVRTFCYKIFTTCTIKTSTTTTTTTKLNVIYCHSTIIQIQLKRLMILIHPDGKLYFTAQYKNDSTE